MVVLVKEDLLSETFDDQRDEDFRLFLNIPGSDSHAISDHLLPNLLSLQPGKHCAEELPNLYRHTPMSATGFRFIGSSHCGPLFKKPGRGFVVKVATEERRNQLWTEFLFNLDVSYALGRQQNDECCTPAALSFVSTDNSTWWNSHRHLLLESGWPIPMPSTAIVRERILPLPKVVRKAIIRKLCPTIAESWIAHVHLWNRDGLARLYLVKRERDLAAAHFSPENLNLYLDDLDKLGIPVAPYATAMAKTLAILHWGAKIDGCGIQFGLGGASDITYNKADIYDAFAGRQDTLTYPFDVEGVLRRRLDVCVTRMFVNDFGNCERWTDAEAWDRSLNVTSNMVRAFFDTRPHFPRPLVNTGSDLEKELWVVFQDAYLETSAKVLGQNRAMVPANLPEMFIDGVLTRGLGN